MSTNSKLNAHRDALKMLKVGDKMTAYQLLKLDDFESDLDKISVAFAEQSEKIVQLQFALDESSSELANFSSDFDRQSGKFTNLQQACSNMLQKLEEAKATISNEETKKEYDEHLIRIGKAGLPRIGFLGGSAIFMSFGISVMIIVVTFVLYPLVVPQVPAMMGDSVTTLEGYVNPSNSVGVGVNSDVIDVNVDIPIQVDPSIDDLLVDPIDTTPVQPAVEQSTVEHPTVEQPAVEQPAVKQPTVEQPAVEQPTVEQPSVEQPTVEQSSVEQPTVEQPAVEQSATLSTPEKADSLPESNSTPNSPASDQTLEPGLIEVPATPTGAEAPTSAQPSVPTADNNARQSVGVEPLASPKQLPTSIINTIAELADAAQTKEQYEQLYQSALEAENNLMKDKEFVFAEQIADIVHKACLRPEGKAFRIDALRQKEKLTQLTKQWIAVSTARVQFEKIEDKTQPNANADVIAIWEIGVDDNWEAGVQYLLVSTNEQIRTAAQKEKEVDLSKVESCIAVADAWWNVSQTPSMLQKSFRNRACYWYSKVQSSVTDKNTKILIEKRLSTTK